MGREVGGGGHSTVSVIQFGCTLMFECLEKTRL